MLLGFEGDWFILLGFEGDWVYVIMHYCISKAIFIHLICM